MSKIKRRPLKRNLADSAEKRMKTIPTIKVIGKFMMYLGLDSLTRQFVVNSWFDQEVATRIADCDIFHGY